MVDGIKKQVDSGGGVMTSVVVEWRPNKIHYNGNRLRAKSRLRLPPQASMRARLARAVSHLALRVTRLTIPRSRFSNCILTSPLWMFLQYGETFNSKVTSIAKVVFGVLLTLRDCQTPPFTLLAT
ncbi:hypothetical protein WAI453_012916 [Rhynchosporium graminicola]